MKEGLAVEKIYVCLCKKREIKCQGINTLKAPERRWIGREQELRTEDGWVGG